MERTSWCFRIARCTPGGYDTDVAARCSSAPRPHDRDIRGTSGCGTYDQHFMFPDVNEVPLTCARRSMSARST